MSSFNYPGTGGGNPAAGQSGQPVPLYSALTGFQDSAGNLQPVVSTTTGPGPLPVIASALPLPTGAATSDNQTNGSQKSQLVDGSGNVVVLSAAGSGASSGLITVQGNASGTPIPVSGSVTAIPSGTQNGNLTQVGGSAISIGQQLSGASLPVVLPAAQITALTPPTTVTANQGTANATPWNQNVSQFGGNAVVTGTGASGSGIPRVTVSSDSNIIVSQATAANLNATVVGTTAAGSGSATGLVTVQGNASGTPIPVKDNATGTTGTTAPTSAIEMGVINGSGNLTGITLGVAAAASSIPTVLATDSPPVPVFTSPSNILTTPTANSLAALNATVQYTMDAGGNYYLTLTNGAGATAAWSGTVTFQYSLNGSTWSSLTAYPVASPANSASTTTTTANGLWLTQAPSGLGSQTVYIRANMTAYTSGTAYFFVSSQAQPNARVILPWIYTVTSGQTLVGPIEASAFSEIDVQISAVTTTVYTAQGTNDPSLTTWVSIPVQSVTSQAAAATTLSAAQTYRLMTNGYKWVRVQCTTTGTVGTIQGVVGTLGQQIVLTSYGNDIGVTVNSGTVTTVSAVTAVTNSTTALPAAQAADIAAVSFTTTTTSATFTPTAGCSYVFEHWLTAYTSGSCQVTIQESVDGTEFHNVYSFPPLAATATYQVSPPLMFNGKSIRYVSSGPAASSLTHSVSRAMMSQQAELPYKSLIDGGSGNGGTINPTTTNSTTLTLPCEGLNNYTAIVNQGSGGTAVTFQLQGTADNTNWITLAQCVGVVGGATPVTMNYQGEQMLALRVLVVTGVASTTINSIFISANIAPGCLTPASMQLRDGSGTTSGTPSTATTALAAQTLRRYLFLQNQSSSATIYINFTTTAVVGQPSIQLLPGASFVQEASFVSPELVSVISTGTSVPYALKYA